MAWTDERIEELTRLWQAGHSASEIGKRLGVSKNAVVGKAHRLKLPSRPSPIKQQSLESGSQQPARAKPVTERSQRRAQSRQAPRAATAGPAAGVQQSPATSASKSAGAAQARASAHRPPARTSASPSQDKSRSSAVSGKTTNTRSRVAAPARTKVEARGSASGCLWPIGDPGDTDFHFCGAEAVPGKPYCAEHAARAYITRSRSQADEEAA